MPNHLPLATGPCVPGIIDVMLGYGKESLFMRLYYPTSEKLDIREQSSKWINWLPDDSYLQGISKVLMLYKMLLKFIFWWSEKIKIPALYGAKPKVDAPLKCIIMSHGLGGCRFLYSNICCELASRGFLVAAIEHRDHSACNTFFYANKDDAERDRRSLIEFKHIMLDKEHYTRRNEQVKVKSEECGKVSDFLIGLNNGTVPLNVMDDAPVHKQKNIDFNLAHLVGKLDLDCMAIMGHSFGGAAALYTLSWRPELKLGILLDPWMFPVKNEDLGKKVLQPLLFINTQTFHIVPNVEAMSQLMTHQDTKMFTIKHTTHENQTDSVLIAGYWLNWFMKKLDPLVALLINNALILNFLNHHVNGPEDISDCLSLLENEKRNVEEGLTKPWA